MDDVPFVCVRCEPHPREKPVAQLALDAVRVVAELEHFPGGEGVVNCIKDWWVVLVWSMERRFEGP